MSTIRKVNPARAGMIRVHRCTGVCTAGKPRASGDDPVSALTTRRIGG